MVMIFSDPLARAQLLNVGLVYTYRKKRRKKVGKDWANKEYGTSKICDIFIEEVGKMKVRDLRTYVDHSGFNRLSDWYGAIVQLNNGWNIGEDIGWLYRVRKTSQTAEEEK